MLFEIEIEIGIGSASSDVQETAPAGELKKDDPALVRLARDYRLTLH